MVNFRAFQGYFQGLCVNISRLKPAQETSTNTVTWEGKAGWGGVGGVVEAQPISYCLTDSAGSKEYYFVIQVSERGHSRS